MNIIFHITTGAGIVAALADTNRIQSTGDTLRYGGCAFISGIIVHGMLDYMPHSYPLAAKVDVIVSLLTVAAFLFFLNNKYRLFAGLSFLGCVFPDLIDLLPSILNKYLGMDIPVSAKLFPWHFPDHSGSIFTGESTVSDINHLIILLMTAIVCWCRRADVKRLFAGD